MSKPEDTTDKPTEDPQAAAAPRPRKIVRRSAATRENPAFTAAEAAAAPAEGAAPAEAPKADAPAAEAPRAEGAPPVAPARRTFDARAPRPAAPAGGEGRPPRPRSPRAGGGDFRGPRSGGGDFRPPPARPMGARPIPGGPRAPASGDFRPPPARPMGARPIPGGPRAPAPEHGEHREAPREAPTGEHREHRARLPRAAQDGGPPGEHRAPRRDHRDRRDPRAQAAPEAPPAPAAAPVKPAAPARPAAAPAKPAPRPNAKPAPKPLPVFIPLARAGQVAASSRSAPTPKEALAAKTKAHAAKVAAKPAVKPAEASAPAVDPALVDIGGEGAAAALARMGDEAGALVDAWLTASNVAAIAEAAESDAVPPSARKAARRAVNVLRARGVNVPTRAHVTKMDERAELSIEATLSPPDPSGAWAVYITSKHASGRFHIAEVIARDSQGILAAGSGWLSGTQIKQNRTRAIEETGVAPVPVPVDWARARIAAARKLNAVTGQVLPLGLERCLELIEPAPAHEPPHPLADLEATLDPASAGGATPTSGSLHNEPEFNAWFPDRGSVDLLLQKVGERLGPEGTRDQEAASAALREEMLAATDRFFSPEYRAVIASRMRDAAISVRSRKGDRRAAEVLNVARAVLAAGLITSPPREIPFLVLFFEKALSLMAQQSGGALRLPVRPGAAPPQAEPPPA
jgi:hypothetical protein